MGLTAFNRMRRVSKEKEQKKVATIEEVKSLGEVKSEVHSEEKHKKIHKK